VRRAAERGLSGGQQQRRQTKNMQRKTRQPSAPRASLRAPSSTPVSSCGAATAATHCSAGAAIAAEGDGSAQLAGGARRLGATKMRVCFCSSHRRPLKKWRFARISLRTAPLLVLLLCWRSADSIGCASQRGLVGACTSFMMHEAHRPIRFWCRAADSRACALPRCMRVSRAPGVSDRRHLCGDRSASSAKLVILAPPSPQRRRSLGCGLHTAATRNTPAGLSKPVKRRVCSNLAPPHAACAGHARCTASPSCVLNNAFERTTADEWSLGSLSSLVQHTR
jgi:hypothetical protein